MKSSTCFLLLLAACEMSRPDGSFAEPDPEPPEVDSPTGFTDDDAGKGARSDASVKIPRRDGGFGLGSSQANPDSPLAPYEGTYLMRMDLFSAAQASALGARLELRSRVSNLLLAEVRLDGDRLLSHETLCHETFAHACEGCTDGFRTTPDENLRMFFPRASAVRTLSVVDGEVRGELAVLAVGFDEPRPGPDTKLPTSLRDDRLWKLDPDDPTRLGLRTRLQTQIGIAKLDCVVTAVQLIASRFQGLPGGAPESPLEDVTFALEVPQVRGEPLAVAGEPALYCNPQLLGTQAAPRSGMQIVRFRRTDARDRCPSVDAFDEALPPAAP